MSSTPYIAKPVLTPQDAIASLVRWKIALLLAAQVHEPLSPRATHSLNHPEECAISKWLLSSRAAHLRETREYSNVLTLHAAFVTQMLELAVMLETGQYESVESIINSPGSFQDASNALANAIMALDRRPRLASVPEKNIFDE